VTDLRCRRSIHPRGGPIGGFVFDEAVTDVFDDMVVRLVDLGCSTATTLVNVCEAIRDERRNHYSETEITRKRDALESLPTPLRVDENLDLCRRSGFAVSEVFFPWRSFAAFLCLKATSPP
jgi:hypothetical protein